MYARRGPNWHLIKDKDLNDLIQLAMLSGGDQDVYKGEMVNGDESVRY